MEAARAAKRRAIVEEVGSYEPKTKKRILNADRIKYWISVGAQPTGTMHNMLVSEGILKGKKINVLPKKTVAKKEEPVAEAAPAPEAPAEAVAA
jgi:small subunit ribosomal protein S16